MNREENEMNREKNKMTLDKKYYKKMLEDLAKEKYDSEFEV